MNKDNIDIDNKIKKSISCTMDFENNKFVDGKNNITVASLYRCYTDGVVDFTKIYDGYDYGYDNNKILTDILIDITYIARTNNVFCVNAYTHNFSYDSGFIIAYLLKNNYKIVFKLWNLSRKEKNFYIFMLGKGGQTYLVSFYFDDILIHFRCSYVMSRLSINEEGKLLGISKKGDESTEALINMEYQKIYNYNDKPPEFFKIYCLRDSEISHKFRLKNFGEKYMTLASRAMFNLEERYKLKTGKDMYNLIKNNKNPKYLWNFCNKAYRGGLSIVNKAYVGQIFRGIHMYDMNSQFPYCMTLKLPVEQITKLEYDNLPDNKRMCIHAIHICNITPIIKNFDFIAVITQNGLKKYLTEDDYKNCKNCYIAYYYDYEWYELLNYFNIDYHIIHTIYFKADTFLKDVINDIYNERIEYDKLLKEDPENPEYIMGKARVKNMLNSSYGKMAQKIYDVRKVPYNHELTKDEIYEESLRIGKDYRFVGVRDDCDVLTKPKFTKKSDQLYYYEIERLYYYKDDFTPIHIGAAITAHSRTLMMKMIRHIGPEFVINGATDSLKIIGDRFPREYIDPIKLGYWKDETSHISPLRYTVLSAKFYVWTSEGKPLKEINTKMSISVTSSVIPSINEFHYICAGITKNLPFWNVKKNINDQWECLAGDELYDFVVKNKNFIIKNAKLSKITNEEGNYLKLSDINKKW